MGNFDELDETLDFEDDEAEAFEDGEPQDAADDLEEYDALDDVAGDDLSEDERAELEAVAAAEDELHDALEDALTETQRELEAQREATRAAVARYREALLAAEPDLPPDLVAGDTIEAVDASIASARQTVARIRERLTTSTATGARGFPVGSPARGTRGSRGLTSAEKIAAGLSERR